MEITLFRRRVFAGNHLHGYWQSRVNPGYI